jgi:DNA-directed RNA polymerase specialized sigma24 family protein
LYGLEGFSVEEISAITDRQPKEVEASIMAIRDHIKKAPALARQFNPVPVAKSTSV